MPSRITRDAGAVCAALALAAAAMVPASASAAVSGAAGAGGRVAQIPGYAHIVVVVDENRAYVQIIGNPAAPYINSLAAEGALFTDSHGVIYPSQPNYLALLAGATFGLTSDSCPHTFSAANLGTELTGAGLSYSGYSESMPSRGFEGCHSGEYARKHNPTADFSNIPGADNKTFAQFPTDYDKLPTVSFVDPNLLDDMHSASITSGDTWLKSNMDSYIQWAMTHNSLFILTWDTANGPASNHVPTLFVGAHITPGQYGEPITHYNVLRTIEQAYGLPFAGQSASAAPITDVFGG